MGDHEHIVRRVLADIVAARCKGLPEWLLVLGIGSKRGRMLERCNNAER